MAELSIRSIRAKAVGGVLMLSGRTLFIQIFASVALFFLTVLLTPSVFGVFYVVSAVIAFLQYFSDIGLAAALIQKKEKLTDEDLITTFTIQESLVIALSIVMMLLTPVVTRFYALNQEGIWLFWALILSFILSSLKTIPSILLERKLEFKKLVLPQIFETVCFYTVVVILALWNFGVTSFTIAVVSRSLIGLVVIYRIAPWPIRIGYAPNVAKKLLRFGVPFQLNSILALVKDDLLVIVLGHYLSFTEIGYIGWAKKWAEVPLRLIMDSVIRVTFPTYSRLQHNTVFLKKAIETTLFGLSILMFPIYTGFIFYIAPFVSFIPRYEKWEPAILSFILFCVSSLIASFSTPLTNTLNALGRIKITLYFMIFWTVATWILTFGGIRLFGFMGVALAQVVLSASIVLVVNISKRMVPFSFMKSTRIAFLGACVQALVYYFFRGQPPYQIVRIAASAGFGAILYVGIIWYFEQQHIRSIIRMFAKKPL